MSEQPEALKLALDALGKWSSGRDMDAVQLNDLIATLESALEQPEQEPKAYTDDVSQKMREAGMTFHLGMPHTVVMEQMTRFHDLVCAEASIKAAAAFSNSPRREWRGLTTAEIDEISDRIERSNFFDIVIPFARAIEAALKERNAPSAKGGTHERTANL